MFKNSKDIQGLLSNVIMANNPITVKAWNCFCLGGDIFTKRRLAELGEDTNTQKRTDNSSEQARGTFLRGAALIFGLTVIAYSRCLNNGFVNYDDAGYITNNPLVQNFSWKSFCKIWDIVHTQPYYPVVFSVYMLQHALWDNNPLGYHATSVLLHAINAVLAYVLVSKLYKSHVAAVITGLLVGLHPLHVDAVARASDLKDILSSTFLFLTLLTYLKYVGNNNRLSYYLSLLLYTAALLARTMAALMPFLLLIVDYKLRRKKRRLELIDKIPFLLVAALLSSLTWHRQAAVIVSDGPSGSFSFYSVVNAWAAMGAYLIKLIAPLRLSVLYTSANAAWWLSVAIFLTIAFVTLTVWMLMLSRDYGFGLAWFVLLVTPVLGFVPFGYVVKVAPYGNQFMYFADVGAFICAGLLARDIVKRLADVKSRRVFWGVVTIAFVLFGLKTALRCGIWRSSEALWRDSIRYNRGPNSTIGHYELAKSLREKGALEEAMVQAKKAVIVYPKNFAARELVKSMEEQAANERDNSF